MQSETQALRLVECRGTPREMGRQYGEQDREAIRHNVEFFTAKRWNPEAGRAFARTTRRLLRERLPDVLDELEGIAEGSGTDADRVLSMNQVDTFGPEWLECTPLAVAKTDAGPIVAKNNDGTPHARFGAGTPETYSYVVRRCSPARGFPMVQVTYSGWLSGLDAMNAAGLANMHASVGSQFDKSGPRLDIRLWAYQLMKQCATARSFLDGLANAALTGKGFNVVVADRAGHTVVVEAAVPLIAWRDSGKPFVYSTNHYVTAALRNSDARSPEAKEISVRRLGYLSWVEETRTPRTLPDVQALLSSHEPWAPCRHGGVGVSHTEWTMIALPQKGEVLVAPGPPCKTPYQTFRVA
jgi:isopenicillin-N N-acyltransferase-like protein